MCISYNTAARGLPDIYARYPRVSVYISGKSRARLCYNICDQACKNQPCSHIKIAKFFKLCLIIICGTFKLTTQIFYH